MIFEAIYQLMKKLCLHDIRILTNFDQNQIKIKCELYEQDFLQTSHEYGFTPV